MCLLLHVIITDLNSNMLQNMPNSTHRYPANVVNPISNFLGISSTLLRPLLFSKKVQDSIAFLNKFAAGDSRDYLYKPYELARRRVRER